MIKLFVSDTNALISYFHEVFKVRHNFSDKAMQIFDCALSTSNDKIKLSIPSVVFIEIFEKWFLTEEFVKKFFYEVFTPLIESPNIEIKPIEKEVLENLINIRGSLANHEINDKIILASAMMLNCPLITNDQSIIDYVNENSVIPSIIN